MAKSLSGGLLLRRALIAALGVALLVLQTLASGPAPRPSQAEGTTIAGAGYCEPHRHDSGAPLPADEDHAPCCLLCVAGRDAPPALPADLSAGGVEPALAFVPLAHDRDEPPNRRPIGWASSWSSRAPPLG
jgi:hypothetical protein